MTAEQAEVLIAELYPRPRGWYLSTRGNLTRTWLGYRLTVFERPPGSGRFTWSAQCGREVRYSPRTYRTEAGAIDGALEHVEATR